MAQRKPIGKKLRFDVFKRDSFCCQYCGAKTPNVVLEIDHILPINSGGNNVIDNLVTSCFDCNRGKGKHELSTMPKSMIDNILIIEEKKTQYKAYLKATKDLQKLKQKELDYVEEIYSSYFENYCFSDTFKNGSLKNFIEKIGHIQCGEYMHKACIKVNDANGSIKYFCGICWNYINNRY